jgi:AcrR family transcriptional regulator
VAAKSRTRGGSETQQRIIRAAADLFHKQGVAATSPDAIIEASGTGKGQFYHYFKNKEGLIHAVLQSHLEAIEDGTAPVHYDVRSWKDLERWFVSHIELQRQFGMTRGCPFGTIGNGLTENDELIRRDLMLIFEVIRNKLAAFFIREKAKGRLAAGADENRLADLCISAVQGAMLMGRVRRESRPVEAAVREVLIHLRRYAERA